MYRKCLSLKFGHSVRVVVGSAGCARPVWRHRGRGGRTPLPVPLCRGHHRRAGQGIRSGAVRPSPPILAAVRFGDRGNSVRVPPAVSAQVHSACPLPAIAIGFGASEILLTRWGASPPISLARSLPPGRGICRQKRTSFLRLFPLPSGRLGW